MDYCSTPPWLSHQSLAGVKGSHASLLHYTTLNYTLSTGAQLQHLTCSKVEYSSVKEFVILLQHSSVYSQRLPGHSCHL